MKLSEAIRLGSFLRPQTFGPFSDKCGTCAMGAALEAVGKLAKTTDTNSNRVKKIWPWLAWNLQLFQCPWCGVYKSFSSIFFLIVHLNDVDHLSRQKIAEMIERVENQATRQLEPNPSEEARAKLEDLESHLTPQRKRKETKDGQKSESSCIPCGSCS
jgi:hypothetical protein